MWRVWLGHTCVGSWGLTWPYWCWDIGVDLTILVQDVGVWCGHTCVGVFAFGLVILQYGRGVWLRHTGVWMWGDLVILV